MGRNWVETVRNLELPSTEKKIATTEYKLPPTDYHQPQKKLPIIE